MNTLRYCLRVNPSAANASAELRTGRANNDSTRAIALLPGSTEGHECFGDEAGLVKSRLSHAGHSGRDDVAGFLIVVGWVGAIATSFVIRGSYERQMGSAFPRCDRGRRRAAEGTASSVGHRP
jgi:hypothetical protein